MKAEKISNALNYLDEDLIAECDNMIKGRASNKARRKANIVPLFGSIAAAAIGRIVGGVILLNFVNDRDFQSESDDDSVKIEVVRGDDAQVEEETDRASSNYSDSLSGAGSSSDPRQFDNAPELAARISVTFEGNEYIVSDPLTAGQRNGNAIGDELGAVEESDNQDFVGAAVYTYNADAENSIVIYIESSDTYYLAEKADN